MLMGRRQGCYSIKYTDPSDNGCMFAMDYDWRPDGTAKKNQWTCAETLAATTHWTMLRNIPDHGLHALLDHFGPTEHDVDTGAILKMSPAAIVRLRRAKERCEGLEPKVMMNMRMGCPAEEKLADNFEVQP